MKGLHGELFGVLGAPSPRADPALLAGLGAGWCTITRNEERRRTLQHSRVHQYTTRRPRLCSKAELHLFRCIALQNQKCSWTRFAAGPGGPETWHCLGRKLRAFFTNSCSVLSNGCAFVYMAQGSQVPCAICSFLYFQALVSHPPSQTHFENA